MRIVVVGGGIIGLLTAVECINAGHHVTIVEQSELPNTAATSYDRHRVVRTLHLGNPGATRAAATAHHMWLELESLLADQVYHVVGALTVTPPENLSHGLALLADADVPGRAIDPAKLADQFQYINFPPGQAAIFEEYAGVLLADRALIALVRWLSGRRDVELFLGQAAIRVDAAARCVTLADGAALRGDRILLAAGPWSRTLLAPHLAATLVLHRQTMLYCQVPETDRQVWANAPAIPSLGTTYGAWLIPPVGSAPLKLSAAEACRVVQDVTTHDSMPEWTEQLTSRFRELVKGFQASWIVSARDCYYLDDAISGSPVLFDLADGEVLAYAACGGGSFKYAPLIARALAGRFGGKPPLPTGLRSLDQTRTDTR